MKYLQRIRNLKWFIKFFNEPKLLRQSSKKYRGGVVQFGGLSEKPMCLQGKLLLRRNIIFNSSFHDVCRYSQYVCKRKLCSAASLISWQGSLKSLTIPIPAYEPLLLKVLRRVYEHSLLYIKYMNEKQEALMNTTNMVRNLLCPPKFRQLRVRELFREKSLQVKEAQDIEHCSVERSFPILNFAEFCSNSLNLRNAYSLKKNWRKTVSKKTKGFSKSYQKPKTIPKERKFPIPLKKTAELLLPQIFSKPPLPRVSPAPLPKVKSFGFKNVQAQDNIQSPASKAKEGIVVPINTVIRKQERQDLIEFDRRIYKAYYANKENNKERSQHGLQKIETPTHLKISVPTQSLLKTRDEMVIESLSGTMELYFKDGKRIFTISKQSDSSKEEGDCPVVDIQVEGGKLTNVEYIQGTPIDFKANLVGSVLVKVRGEQAGIKFFTPELVKGKVDAFMNHVCQFLIFSSLKNMRDFHTDSVKTPIRTLSSAKDCTPCSGGKTSQSKSAEKKRSSNKSVCEKIIKQEVEREPIFSVEGENTEKTGCAQEQNQQAVQAAAKKELCGDKEVRPKVSQCSLKGVQRAIKQKPKDTRSCPDLRQVICKELRSDYKAEKKCKSENLQKDFTPNESDCIQPKRREGEKPKCDGSDKSHGGEDSKPDILKKVAKTIPTQKTTIKFTNPMEVCFDKITIPPVRDNEVLVKMDTVGICLADIHMYETGVSHYNGEEIPLGHEGSGTVIQVGCKVSHLKFGDKVVIEPSEACGRCLFCKSGRPNLCQETKFAGVMSNYIVHCGNCCHKLPIGVTLEQGALTYPLSLAIHACRLGCISLGSKVLVIGACPVGISAIMCARAMGAKDIAIVDSEEANLKIARCIGANSIIQIDTNAETESLCQKLSCEMKSRPNIVIDSCGSTKSIDLATNVIQPGGVNVVVGCQEENPTIPMLASLVKELVIKTSFRSYNTFPLALEMIRNGSANVEKLITHRFEFSKAKEAFETALNETKCKALKVVIKFPKNE